MNTRIFGRTEELARIAALLRPGSAQRVLVLTGGAGSGKTALWCAGVARAARSHEVLQCVPAAAERHLAYSGLSDLLNAVDPAVLDALPSPQSHALRVAMLVADPAPSAPDERAVAYGLLGILRALAAERRVLVAIDDLQWLDSPSAQALSYVVRRCGPEVAFLLSSTEPHAFHQSAVSEVVLGPLGLGPLHRLVQASIGIDLARPELLRLHAESGGNPQQALQIARGSVGGREGHPDRNPTYAPRAELEAEIAAGGERAGAAHAQLALITLSTRADVTIAREHAQQAVDLLGEACPVEVLTCLAVLENFAGPSTTARLEQALELARTARVNSSYEHPVFWSGHRLMLEDRFDEARTQFLSALAMAAPRGDEWSTAAMLVHVAELECRAGNWAVAAAHARQCRSLTDDAAHGQPGLARYAEAMVEVRRGDLARATQLAAEGERLAEAGGDELYRIQNIGVLAHAAVVAGDWAKAAKLLRDIPDHLRTLGWREPTVFPLWPDAIESLMVVGEIELATRYHSMFASNATAYARPTAQATAARCAGLLQATRGDVPGALQALSTAVELHHQSPDRYELARTLLALGVTRRRARMKRAAREALGTALAIFEELGSPLWAERVRAETARIGGRVAATELTEAEERVADLAARGATNRAIANGLFLTEKTVEVHLSRIYRKVGVRSRAELAHLRAGKR